MNGQQQRNTETYERQVPAHADGTGDHPPNLPSIKLGSESAQIHSNGEGERQGRDDDFWSARTPRTRALAHRQRVAVLLEEEDANRRRVLAGTLAELHSLARLLDPRIQLYGRIKSIASVSDKMSTNDLGVHQVLDIIGVRAVTHHTDHCYHLINLVHRDFAVLECEFDDYIAAPKASGYRSIHTTVVSPRGFPVEIQARTQWMDALSQRGPAAHSRYKETRASWVPLPKC